MGEANAMGRSSGYSHITVRPTGGALGAEIRDVDLAEALSEDAIKEVHRAWLDHHVIFFRDQEITPAQYVAFAARLGELDTYPFIEPLPDQPAVIPIIKEKNTRINFGGGWHSDTTYQASPPKATMLYALDAPTTGGDTMYANMVTAYDALSPGYKALIADLKGVYTASKVHGNAGYYKNADHPMAMKEKDMQQVEERFEHPIVRTHPETGMKALFVSVPHIDRFKQMTKEESQPILDYLGRHATKAEFVYRFHWEVGSLALWDNRCVQHYALNDYPGQRREMHRVTLKGDVPR